MKESVSAAVKRDFALLNTQTLGLPTQHFCHEASVCPQSPKLLQIAGGNNLFHHELFKKKSVQDPHEDTRRRRGRRRRRKEQENQLTS